MHNTEILSVQNKKILFMVDTEYKRFSVGNCTFWIKSNFEQKRLDDLISNLLILISSKDDAQKKISGFINNIYGNFSLIVKSDCLSLIAVDKIRTYPLYYIVFDDQIVFSSNAKKLVKKYNLKVSTESALCIASSGYTIGNDTLFKGLNALCAGEFALFTDRLELKTYYMYSPWKEKGQQKKELLSELKTIVLELVSKIYHNNVDKTIVIPLSAGFDSRLLVSAFKEIGATNIMCFSYGIKGNSEALTAKKVAEKLGYKWEFILLDIKKQREFQRTKLYSDFYGMVDSGLSIPFYQDVAAIYFLKQIKNFPSNPVFINGNSADFISGGHIPTNSNNEISVNYTNIVEKILTKHFSLWPDLLNNKRLDVLQTFVSKEISRVVKKDASPKEAVHIFEGFEYLNRQTKYVVSGQLAYDFLGYSWELPFWDEKFMNFWQIVPNKYKKNQLLYKEFVYQNNWGGVWDDIPINSIKISPIWLRYLRVIFKILFIPFGKSNWHKFDRKFIFFYSEVLGLYAQWSYVDLIKEKMQFRNSQSWFARDYLNKKSKELFKKIMEYK